MTREVTVHIGAWLARGLPVLIVLRGADLSAQGSSQGEEYPSQTALYIGKGGHGVEPMPSAHYELGLRCVDCHSGPPAASGLARAGSESCDVCHDPRYGRTLDRWTALLINRWKQLEDELGRVEQVVDNQHSQTEAILADVRTNLELVQIGTGVHNIDYSLALIQAGRSLLNQALERAGAESLPGSSWGLVLAGRCASCHQGVEQQAGRFDELPFVHAAHLASGLQCDSCHRPHEVRSAGEVVIIKKEECIECHHVQDATQAELCLNCHRGVMGDSVVYQDRPFNHSVHGEYFGLTCADCHDQEGALLPSPREETCEGCHPS